MPASVRFRLPGQTQIHEIRTQQTPLKCASLEEIPPTEGYLFAPFVADDSHPLWFIPADERKSWEQPTEFVPLAWSFSPMDAANRSDYSRAFSDCQDALQEAKVEKIVLSRTHSLKFASEITENNLHSLFERACLSYPQSFVSLVSLPKPWGTWLMATPEILLTAENGQGHTMALAGTMERTADAPQDAQNWSEKNRREQRWVVDFISTKLRELGLPFQKSPTHVQSAGQLLHLCTDFDLHFSPIAPNIHHILAALHPTPAVCGWPADAAKSLISTIESHHRSYYSGYSGLISPTSAQLFVTLRCMHLHNETATLYAGGGLLRESSENSEWEETERKLGTMLRLFSTE